MEDSPNILLLDHTSPHAQPSGVEALSQVPTELSRNLSRRWSRSSVRGELTKRKYAKWQPHRLGITDDGDAERSSHRRDLSLTGTNTAIVGESNLTTISSQQTSGPSDTNQISTTPSTEQGSGGQSPRSGSQARITGLKPGSALDILYENQRGWFFCGIPLYSHRSLLNFDPGTWVTHDFKDSPVDITTAQLPDPSWEWAWRMWYVDMSGDVDDQGWQYSFSFGSSAWHGSHPWFHSFVRRRRWVRLRVKRASERSRQGQTGLELSHMLNEDYFTIHSGKMKRALSLERASRVTSGYLSGATTKADEGAPLEEIGNIPTLMRALKGAVVDREKIDALRRFIEEGGHELYYLDEKIPDIMSMFVFQASRSQFLTHLNGVIDELYRQISQADDKEVEDMQRKKEHLEKAAGTVQHHLRGPEIVSTPRRHSAPEMLDLTPSPKKQSHLSRHLGKFSFKPMDDGGPIKGIPKAAGIGREVHIYQYSP
ncbi:hypothetical protein EYZ11_003738 [Aspergillus tanneri]|uniref:Peroxin/Ferlin domain-containing protein n=1 Tax=Aspergillus tanneri TaxID=1220188 RepID=A0A4S3JMM0_9EURO|nr:uncharacterized protein ATNIH1004_007519 [Aspergillus tanneri]KAA8646096.1 hypothetical protein ATNIH1004_007519 [Aspergillus tanneri]THC96773.1 hypothetical protein EYZ11_003738 [Aspergillus tanneri]